MKITGKCILLQNVENEHRFLIKRFWIEHHPGDLKFSKRNYAQELYKILINVEGTVEV
jgi:hypothetical protein